MLPYALVLSACGGAEPPPAQAPAPVVAPAPAPGPRPAAVADEDDLDTLVARADQMFGQLPAVVDNPDNPVTDAKVALGRMLFFEPRLSLANDISCNTCHALDEGGVDGDPTSTGHQGQRGGRNAPTVLNAALHASQFWDGRAKDVEAQALGPITNPIEMALPSLDEAVSRLKGVPGYPEAFGKAFPDADDAVTAEHIGMAIGAFERRLITPGRFDRFMDGDEEALSPEQIEGLRVFLQTGCAACHSGPALGGQSLQKLGVVEPWETSDLGRFEVTKKEVDRFVFKVPSLRNIGATSPYFHDGSVASLDEAIRRMARHQLGKKLNADEVQAIRAFLLALEGEPPAALVEEPQLPG